MKFRQITYLLILICSTNTLWAQPGTTTEAEVKIQELFIEAGREKIMERFEKAADLYKEVLKQSSQNAAASYELARVYDVMDEDESALKAIKNAVNWDGNNIWYQFFLADVYQKMNKFTDAATVFENLTKTYPKVEDYYLKHAYFLVKANQTKEAIKVYDQIESNFGITEEFIRRKHTLYVGLGDTKKAAGELQKLVNKFPKNTNYLHLLAGFYTQAGDIEAAKSTYKKILAIDKDDAKAQLALADGPKANNDVTYLQTLKPIFAQADENIDVKIKALFPFIEKIDAQKNPTLTQAALELGELLAQTHPEDAKAHSIKGDLLYYAGKPQEALAAYKRTIELNKSVFAVWDQMMYIHAEANDMDALLEVSENALDVFPNQARAYYMNGVAYSAKTQSMNAVSSFEQALLMSNRDPSLKLDVLSKLSLEYTSLKKYDRAKKYLDKGLEMRADDPRILDALGWWHYQQNDFEAAKTNLEKAIEKGGAKSPYILEHLGDTHAKLGNSSKAKQFWQQAKEYGSTSPNLDQKLQTGGL